MTKSRSSEISYKKVVTVHCSLSLIKWDSNITKKKTSSSWNAVVIMNPGFYLEGHEHIRVRMYFFLLLSGPHKKKNCYWLRHVSGTEYIEQLKLQKPLTSEKITNSFLYLPMFLKTPFQRVFKSFLKEISYIHQCCFTEVVSHYRRRHLVQHWRSVSRSGT